MTMLCLLAQTPAPTLPPVPESWTNLIVQLVALIVAVTALIGAVKAMRGTSTNAQNNQALAAGVLSNSKAINAATGVDNIPAGVTDAARAIRNDPTTPAPTPPHTDPEPAKPLPTPTGEST